MELMLVLDYDVLFVRSTLVMLFASSFLWGCDEAVSAGKIQHPTPDNLPADAEMADIIRMNGNASLELQALAARLAGAREVLSLGALEGDRDSIFGAVADLRVWRGGFAVLDSRYNEVRLYDARANLVEAFGSPGRGPNEFLSPDGLDSDQPDRFVISDRNAEIKVFDRSSGVISHQSTIHLTFTPEDFCMLGERIFVQGMREAGGTLHAYSVGGKHLHSFGEPYTSENPLVRSQLSDGRVGCSDDARTVVAMYEHLPVIYGYTPDGRLRWRSRLADFHSISIEEGLEPDGQPYVLMGSNADAYDQVESLAAMPGGFMVLQIAHHTPQSTKEQGEYAELRTYLVSARDGKGIYVGNKLPRIHDVEDGSIFAAVDDPFPQVKVFEMSPVKEAP